MIDQSTSDPSCFFELLTYGIKGVNYSGSEFSEEYLYIGEREIGPEGLHFELRFFLVSGAFFGAKLLTVLHGRTAGGRSNHMDMHGWYLSFRSSSLHFIFWITTKMEKS